MLLLTGATGLVGGELLRALSAANPNRRIGVLVRNPAKLRIEERLANVEFLHGDLTAQQLGLADTEIKQLQSDLTEVLHCAAETRFSLPLNEIRRTNVIGTANLLKLASRCSHLRKFAYVSTVYVAGRTEGRISEAPIVSSPAFSNSYQQSKFEAEQVVLSYAEQMPVAIFRLSSIIGDSQTGQVTQFNYVHHLLRLFPRNVLPVFPGNPKAPMDLISSDWALPALAWLFENHFSAGQIFHLCAGAANSLTLQEMVELTTQVFEAHPQSRRWKPIRVPQMVSLAEYMVSLAEYEECTKERLRNGDRLLTELLRVLNFFVPQLAFYQEFENRRTLSVLSDSDLRIPAIRETYGRVVNYCIDTHWGQHASAARHC